MTTTTYPDGSASTTNYDSASRVSSTVDRNGNSTSYATTTQADAPESRMR